MIDFQLFSNSYALSRVTIMIGPKHHNIYDNYYFNMDYVNLIRVINPPFLVKSSFVINTIK